MKETPLKQKKKLKKKIVKISFTQKIIFINSL